MSCTARRYSAVSRGYLIRKGEIRMFTHTSSIDLQTGQSRAWILESRERLLGTCVVTYLSCLYRLPLSTTPRLALKQHTPIVRRTQRVVSGESSGRATLQRCVQDLLWDCPQLPVCKQVKILRFIHARPRDRIKWLQMYLRTTGAATTILCTSVYSSWLYYYGVYSAVVRVCVWWWRSYFITVWLICFITRSKSDLIQVASIECVENDLRCSWNSRISNSCLVKWPLYTADYCVSI